MAVEGFENFHYVGYTLGGLQPTLYFEEGRYTQQHEEERNVGWHPLHEAHCYRHNIDQEGYDRIMQIDMGDPEEAVFARAVIDGRYRAPLGEGHLCELFTDDNAVFGVHISRACLIRPGEAGYAPEYDAAYVLAVLRNGDLAANEHE